MLRFGPLLAAVALLVVGPAALLGQDSATATPVVDSILVEGNARLTQSQIVGTAGLVAHQPINYRDVQRAIGNLFRTGQFDDVLVEQRTAGDRLILIFKVKERPVLERWAVRGVQRLGEGSVKGRVKLTEGRPLDRNAVQQSRASIDSLYKNAGYYAAEVKALELPQQNGKIRVVFDVTEGERVAISQVVIDGNKHYSDKSVVNHMATKPEGFFWFQKGEYDEDKLEQDERERLPRWYADRGFVDFQVTNDSLHADSAGGKATLHVTVDEGQAYHVGTFDMEGNRRFSREDLLIYYPFGPLSPTGTPFGKRPFSQSDWDAATEKVQNLYANNGYIYAQVVPEESRRTGPDGTPMVDLRWTIREG
jgi:outer membrane protein insertion porin family